VHLVMGSASALPIEFRVLIDGKPPSTSHGGDVDAEGKGVLKEPRMYQLIRQSGPVTESELQIEFLGPSAELFVITFG